MSKTVRTPETPRPTTIQAGPTEMMFQRKNYILFAIGVALIVIGFLLMSGGSQANPNEWDESTIYSFRRITLAPFTVIVGLCVVVYGIFKK